MDNDNTMRKFSTCFVIEIFVEHYIWLGVFGNTMLVLNWRSMFVHEHLNKGGQSYIGGAYRTVSIFRIRYFNQANNNCNNVTVVSYYIQIFINSCKQKQIIFI